MRVITVTLLATPTPVIPGDPIVQRAASFQWALFQVRTSAANPIYIGDNAVSSTNGIQLLPGSLTAINCPLGYTESLNGWYASGTAGDKLTIMVIE